MLYHADKYKNYKAPVQNETKYNRGYSFYKTDASIAAQNRTREHSQSVANKTVSDSYFFPSTKSKEKEIV